MKFYTKCMVLLCATPLLAMCATNSTNVSSNDGLKSGTGQMVTSGTQLCVNGGSHCDNTAKSMKPMDTKVVEKKEAVESKGHMKPNVAVGSDHAAVFEKCHSKREFVMFDFNSSEITPEGRAMLKTLAENVHMKAKRIMVVGHADKIGSQAVNMALSIKRAQAVAKVLVAHGVPKNKLKVRGVGSRFPVSDQCQQADSQAMKACLAKDRRVVVVVK